MENKTRYITVTGIGIALFVVLTMCLQVPVFENYYLCLGYVAMMVYCYLYGAVPGAAVGTFGVIIYCIVISGLRGMPGWALGNLASGLVCGVLFQKIRKIDSLWMRRIAMSVIIIVMTAAGILGIKSLTECLLYAQPMIVRIAKNSYAFVADIAVMLLSIPVCEILERYSGIQKERTA